MLGSDIFIDPADQATFIGSVKWTRPDGRDSVLASVIAGSGHFNASRGVNNPDVLDVVWTHKINPRLSYTFEGLLGYQDGVPDIGAAHWIGVINYLTCELLPHLSGTARLELFDDAQGQRTGFAGLYTAVATGLSWRPLPWITVRPEVRYDTNDEARPFEGHHSLFNAAADVIVRW